MLLLAGALLVFVISPYLRKIGASQAAIRSAVAELSALEQKIAGYKTAIAELAKIETNKEEIVGLFPKRENMVSLVSGIESAVARAGAFSELKIIDKKEDPLAADVDRAARPVASSLKGVEEVPYKLTLSGNYRSFTDFLLYFEHQPFISELKKIGITAITVQDETSKVLRNTGLATGIFEGVFFIARAP